VPLQKVLALRRDRPMTAIVGVTLACQRDEGTAIARDDGIAPSRGSPTNWASELINAKSPHPIPIKRPRIGRDERMRAPGYVDTDSGASRTPIPPQAKHRFRAVRTA